ncbi:MAG: hypothetical protein WA790_04585 [Sulfitobacter sp.]
MTDTSQDTSTVSEGADTLSMAQIELSRYQARLGVWKVVLGSFIVGMAGIIIPAAINMTTLLFDSWQKEARFELEKQTAHQQYIKDFFETAVNQDVELRIRFANYFANLSDGEQKLLWRGYFDQLVAERNASRAKINALEADLVKLQKVEQTVENVTELDLIARELNWTYAEIGYVPLDRGVVQIVGGKKERLYGETIEVIAKLSAASDLPVDPESAAYKRFWELYRRDLIGVESTFVANRMVAFGKELKRLAEAGEAPSPWLMSMRQEVQDAMQLDLAIGDAPEPPSGRLGSLRELSQRSLAQQSGDTLRP